MKLFIANSLLWCLSLVSTERLWRKKHDSVRKAGQFYSKDGHFYKDGKQFRVVSGAVHYFRIEKERWGNVLRNCKSAGLNTVETYVPWSLHFPIDPRQGHFDGRLDLDNFLHLAHDVGLNMILRVGPFVDAELDFGGLPVWLLQQNVSFRTSDSRYIAHVLNFLQSLSPVVVPMLYKNGGPVIMMQVENEYGSFGCDSDYLVLLENSFRSVFNDTLLFTTDGCSYVNLKCGNGNYKTGLLPTVDFGPSGSSFSIAEKCFNLLRQYSPDAPLMCSEFYTGWFTSWGHARAETSIEDILLVLKEILDMGGSVNMYVFMGGTNYAHLPGFCEYKGDRVVTSYDYDGPLDQGGNPTKKYYGIKMVLSSFDSSSEFVNDEVYIVPAKEYGNLTMAGSYHLFDVLEDITVGSAVESRTFPVMEEIGQFYGFCLINATLPKFEFTTLLEVSEVLDEVAVIVGRKHVGLLRNTSPPPLALPFIYSGSTVSFLLQILGRDAQARHSPLKTVVHPRVGGVLLEDFKAYRLDINKLAHLSYRKRRLWRKDSQSLVPQGPYVAHFRFILEKTPKFDTHLDLGVCFTTGYVLLNKLNIGYFNNLLGPQLSLYVPRSVLKRGPNELLVFNYFPSKDNCKLEASHVIKFGDHDLWRGNNIE